MNSQLQIKASTLTELLLEKRDIKEKGISFIKSKAEEVYCTYGNIFAKSLLLLGYLQGKGLKPNDHLVFQLEDNYEFIHMFWACVLGGITPVPIVAEEKDEHRRKLYNVLSILGTGSIIGKKTALSKLKLFAEQNEYDYEWLRKRYLCSEEAFLYAGASGQIHEAKPSETAFIQFSSGSTGMPKGVVLTHSNLITNIDAIVAGAALNDEDVIVSWMPLTHDMGLIGSHLAVSAANMEQYIMDTKLFVMKPAIWLDKITEHKATILSSPNFGLKYSIMGLERSRTRNFDFSSVRLIFNGAEPISAKVCDEFLNKTAAFGMKPSVMFPVYGMAEASLAIAFPRLNEGQINRIVIDRHSLEVGSKVTYLADEQDERSACYVDEGYPVKNCEFRLADADDRVLGADTLGMIQIRGGNVSEGYYGDEAASLGSRTSDGWFKTGDIGFLCKDRLVVIGRLQDMVIVNGQNYFSNDLERIASEVEKVELNKTAVCSVWDSETESEKVALFVVHKGDARKFVPVIGQLRAHFAQSLGMTIDFVVPVVQIPKTSSGKLMRFILKTKFEKGEYKEVIERCSAWIREERSANVAETDSEAKAAGSRAQYDQQEVERAMLVICQELAPDWPIGLHDNLFEYGINSLLLNQIASRMDDVYPNKLKVEDFFTYPSIGKLAEYICEPSPIKTSETSSKDKERKLEAKTSGSIAIIGMAANLPGAADVEQFWSNLVGSVESVGPLPAGRQRDLDEYLTSLGTYKESEIRDAGFLYEIDKFDYEFFKILKREAIAMSPSQRLFLQTAYSSMENGGYGGEALRSSRTGVYVGYISDLDGNQYQNILKHSKDSQSATGALTANISGRLSYFMDFKGPSMLVDSACSSSMSALNLACQGINNGDCDQAIVGGVQLKVLPVVSHADIGIESSDGHTRPFAEDADGTGEGEGIVSILIKPYEQAVKDRDQIYAVIRAAHSNQDGYSVGLSAPNPEAQAALVTEALDKAEVEAEHITYIEAHGTGTKLGDPIEVHALTKAFRMRTEQEQFCAIGSVKSNIGHLYASSGLASIMKCSLMLTHRMIPATVNIKAINHRIPFEGSPFFVNTQNRVWEAGTSPRRCGVSNFGFSGTNCHAILEEHREQERVLDTRQSFPFVLSAFTREGLEAMVKAYYEYLTLNHRIPLPDISFTAAMGRGHYPYRLAMVVKDTEELIGKLEAFEFATQLSKQIYVGSAKPVHHTRRETQWGELTVNEAELLGHSTAQCIAGFTNRLGEAGRDQVVKRLCELYVRGAKPVWNDFFEQEDVRRVSLPTYLFKAYRCWPQF